MLQEKYLLDKVVQAIEDRDFFNSVFNDDFDDWDLVKKLGEFLVGIMPDSEIMGHALLTRALRHLGDKKRAYSELTKCKARMTGSELGKAEKDMLVSLITKEESLLSPG
jgi:hypothetical protein